MDSQRCYVGLGANLGDAARTVREAVAALATLRGCRLAGVSDLYASAPVDAGGPEFVNAVAALDCSLQPEALLAELQALETRFGRLRPYRNAPRTLDLDLLFFGDREVESPGLSVPHPRLHERRFVLEPLLQLAPGIQHPRLGPLAACLPQVLHQALRPLT